MLFIGTRFSNLNSAVDTPAEAACVPLGRYVPYEGPALMLYTRIQARAAETSTPERGEQEPGTTTRQPRAAADGYDMKNSKCYNNISETDSIPE